jgi:archaeosortase C (PEF-CTERM variant)
VEQRPPPKAYLQLLLGLVLAFQGLALAVTSNKLVVTHPSMRVVGIAMAIGGLYYLYRYLPREVLVQPMDEAAKARAARDMVMRLARGARGTTLAERFVDMVSIRGRLLPLFPIIGVAVIVADLLWNLVITGSTEFLTYDWIAILVGCYLIGHNYVPSEFHRERDFAFVFLFALSVLLLVPVLIERGAAWNAASAQGISAYSEYLLAKPVEGMLTVSGITSDIDGITIVFLTREGGQISLLIATSCSGVYSFAIFTSAFLAFVATEFRNWDPRLKWFLGLGILAAYIANLIRMYIIVLMGHLYGRDELLWTHANAGWLIYMAWIALFWWMLFRWFFRQQDQAKAVGVEAAA